MLVLLACLAGGIASCGKGGNAGNTAGPETYTVTVTGTSGTTVETCTFSVSVS
jgi:hypothetical protein